MTPVSPSEAPSRSEAGLGPLVVALVIAASIAAVFAIWTVEYLPTGEGPRHILLAHLGGHFGDQGAGFARYVQPSPQVTGLAFSAVFSPLERIFAWRTALRLTLSVNALVWGWGYTALVVAIDRRRAALGLLGFVGALGWALYMGFFPFVLATGLSFAVLAAALARWPLQRRDRAAIGAMLFVLALAHAFAAAVAVLVLGCVIGARSEGRARWRELGLLVLVSLPTLVVAALAASTWIPAERESLGLFGHLTMLGGTFVSGPAWRSWPILGLAVAGLVGVVQRARRREAAPAEIGVGVAAAVLLGAGLIAPLHLGGWDFVFPRFVPAGALLAAALLPVERLASRAQRLGAVAALAAFALASSAWAAGYHRDLRGRAAEALSGLDQPLHRSGPRLALVLDPYVGLAQEWTGGAADWREAAVPYAAPLANLGALYALTQGGVPAGVFDAPPRTQAFALSPEGQRLYPDAHDPVQARNPRVTSNAVARRKLLTWLAAVGVPFEDVILSGQPGDGDLFAQRGYVADFRGGGLFIGRFEGCPVRVEVTAPSPLPRSLAIDYGFSGVIKAPNTFVIPAGATAPEGKFTVTPRRPLCGDAWLRAALVDAAAPHAPPRFCDGSGKDGRIRVHVTREVPVIACAVVEAPAP